MTLIGPGAGRVLRGSRLLRARIVTHRRCHRNDDRFRDAPPAKLFQFRIGKIEIRWRVFNSLDNRSFGETRFN